MIYLLATTDILRTTVSSAALIDVHLNYVDGVKAGGALTNADRVTKQFVAAGSDDTLTGPGGSTSFRSLKQGTWRNKDATLAADVTVINRIAGPIDVELYKVTLQPGESLIYIEGIGWFKYGNAAVLDKVLVTTADQAVAVITFADIAGLTVPLLAGKRYTVRATIFHTNNASTTGSQFAYNIGAAPTLAQFGNDSAVTNSPTAGVVALGTATARDTAITLATTGQTAVGKTTIEGMIQPSADGTFALRVASEVAVAAGVTVKAGSFMEVRQER